MEVKFYKYQGTGNDFVMIDNRQECFPVEDQALISRLCHRRFGIGADGLILIQNHADFDFEMVYFNADGKKGSFCGNGGRCSVAFANRLGMAKDHTEFWAADGLHRAKLDQEGLIWLQMTQVKHLQPYRNGYFLNTGSPHVVLFEKNIDRFPVFEEGQKIRWSEEFAPGGTNVNFVEVITKESIFVRTYERGVEEETYSCGTGVTAAALAHYYNCHSLPSSAERVINVQTRGGNLKVAFHYKEGIFFDIWLIGPAECVFSGQIQLFA
ncbi:MAG: diaminopimelate epimerase [Cytophagales bacterium]|nr:diaminopimelate epimerase [Bernardetiaceae bacterium]MDW8211454.1 diaminopimelate epimerase [Cytophagales bacterium]